MNEGNSSSRFSRREVIKGLATLPVLGYFANRFYVKHGTDFKKPIVNKPQLGLSEDSPNILSMANMPVNGDKLRIGVVGNGMRGPQILRAMGFASKSWIERNTQNGQPNQSLQSFLNQDDLKIEITGVCDTFSVRAEEAQAIAASFNLGGEVNKPPKIYPTYREMLDDDNLDAIVILTPDHWHARMATDAAQAGKHIYLEKPMCQTADEAKMLRDVIRKTGVVLQVGHQNRQQASYIKAKEIIEKGILGDVSLVETFTNRNNDHGAWIREIPSQANGSNVNWKEFLGHKSFRELDLDRYFNWQKWFEYGTGPAGNQFTHEYDCMNQVLGLGIPARVVATGGNYYFKDPRDIPDVFNAIFEYPSRGLSLTYDCTLRSSKPRDNTILGRDASMEINISAAVYPDRQSERYKEYGLNHDEPIYSFHPRVDLVDAVTSATAKYYHERGFGYSYHNGQRIDATYLHMKEWMHCVRNGIQPSCNIDRGFEETVTFYMSNLAYLEKRVVGWDPEKEIII
jgi:predicted dehydrogenase